MLPWVKSINVWALVAILACVAVIFAGYERIDARKRQANEASARGTVAAEAVKAAIETAAAERKAVEDTPLPADKAAVIELCKRRASCRERGKL